MKHYTYQERYEKLKKAVKKYMAERNGPFIIAAGGPRIELRVSRWNKDGNKKIWFDFIAHKQKVGYGIEKISRLFAQDYEYERLLAGIEAEIVNHPLNDPIVSIGENKVRFRYVINPREEYIEQW